MVFRTNEGSQARGLLAARTKYSHSKEAQHIRELCHKIDELELELIQTQMAQKPVLRAEVGMRVRCANKASAE